jgi:hypothetical protein
MDISAGGWAAAETPSERSPTGFGRRAGSLTGKVRDMRNAWSLITMLFLITVANAHAVTAPPEAGKFDEFGDIYCDEEKARLDNFANELQNHPDAQGYIIFYGGKRQQSAARHNSRLELPRQGEAAARVARLKPYISSTRGIDSDRVVVIDGGYRDLWAVELWIVPKGAKPPAPTATVKPQEVRFRRGRIKKREYECGV